MKRVCARVRDTFFGFVCFFFSHLRRPDNGDAVGRSYSGTYEENFTWSVASQRSPCCVSPPVYILHRIQGYDACIADRVPALFLSIFVDKTRDIIFFRLFLCKRLLFLKQKTAGQTNAKSLHDRHAARGLATLRKEV